MHAISSYRGNRVRPTRLGLGVFWRLCHQQQFRGAILNVSQIAYDYHLPLLVITGNITGNITDYSIIIDTADGQLKLLPLLPSFSNIYYLFHFVI